MKQKDYFAFISFNCSICSCFWFIILYTTQFISPSLLNRWFVFSLSRCSCPLLIFSLMFSLPHHAPFSSSSPFFLFCPLSLNTPTIPPALFRPFSLCRPSSFLPLTPPLCLVKVEAFVWMPRRRPLSLCPCCSPEGNVTLPPLLLFVAGYLGNGKDLRYLA